jgi:hypothetical protein
VICWKFIYNASGISQRYAKYSTIWEDISNPNQTFHIGEDISIVVKLGQHQNKFFDFIDYFLISLRVQKKLAGSRISRMFQMK